MTRITFKAKLEAAMEGKGWTFATLPRNASEKLPRRGRVSVEGTINGHAFATSAFPDGEGGHFLSVNAAMRKGAGADQGDVADFIITPVSDDVEVNVPPGLADALAANAVAKKQWDTITPKARAEWVKWVTGAKKEETRDRRTARAVERLAEGVKRPYD